MAFRFTLDAVLRYRQALEEREQQRLGVLLAQRAALRDELQQATDARLRLRLSIEQTLRQQLTPAVEIHFAQMQEHGIEMRCDALRERLRKLQEGIAEQTARYRQERQKREVLDALRQVQLRNYRMVQQRRQQAALDELYLLRRREPS